MRKNIEGFTLAELMITIGIIGVIAVILVNATVAINSKVHEKARNQAVAKITQIMRVLNAKDLLHGISTTDEFANILQENVKVIKRCDSDHLADCFPKTITRPTAIVMGSTSGLKQEDASSFKTGEKLGNPANTSGNVGLVLADGISMIISYDTSCESNPYDNNGVTDGCIIAIYDINGMANPNKVNEDIGLLNASLGAEACVEVDGICVSVSDISYTPTQAEPYTGTPTAANGNCTNFNYWDGAKQACAEMGMHLPTIEEASRIAFYRDQLNLSYDYYWFDKEPSPRYAMIYNRNGIYGDQSISKGCMHHKYELRCVK